METKKDLNIRRYIKIGGFFYGGGLLFVWFFVIILKTPACFNWLDLSESGPIGDTIAGISAPFIGVAGVVLTFLAFFIQYKANKIQFDQFEIQNTITIKSDKSRIIEWLMEKNREIVNQMKINELCGVKVFHAIVDEFRIGYKYVCKNVDTAYKNDFIGITYLLLYNGIGKLSNPINRDLLDKIVNLEDLMKKIDEYSRRRFSRKASDYQYYQGHQVRLGNYFRNLFQIFTMIRELDKKYFSVDDKYQLGKYLRTQMSTYEQMIILFNSQSIYGKPLIDNNIISDFKLIKNIPLPMLDFCINSNELEIKFPSIDFEWIDIKSRKAM